MLINNKYINKESIISAEIESELFTRKELDIDPDYRWWRVKRSNKYIKIQFFSYTLVVTTNERVAEASSIANTIYKNKKINFSVPNEEIGNLMIKMIQDGSEVIDVKML